MPPSVQFGLIARCTESYEPKLATLEAVDVEVSVRGFAAKVNASLKYKNDFNYPIQVEYRIPVDEGAAVYKFEAIVDGRKIMAQIMEKKKAENVYKNAVEAGHSAVLAREDNLLSDVFHLNLGNLPPGASAELQLSMIMELPVKTDGAVNFTLPAVLNPRYCPADITRDQHTRPVRVDGDFAITVFKPYTFGIKASVQGGHSIARIISHSDALNVNISDDRISAQVTQDGGFTSDHDWSMLLYYSNPYKTHVIRETGDRSSTGLMKDDLIMVNLHPEIAEQSYSSRNEVIFVVDCSGSMRGSRMESAKATLLIFLKSLPAECYFNVISFGSTFSLLFKSGSQKYSEKTLNEACSLHKTMDANMGGTEILQPLKWLYSKDPIPGYSRQVLLLSDGDVMNNDQVKELVSRQAHETRVFAVGIGEGASTALIKGLARAGRGRYEMVYQQDKLQLKVMGLVRSMLQESVQNVYVTFDMDPPGGIKLIPKVPPVIFGGQHLILYTRVPSNAQVKSVSIKGTLSSETFVAGIQGSDVITVHDEEKTLHRLAARSQINQWQIDEEEGVAEDMISLSLASGVVCRRTALVGLDQDMTPIVRPPKPQENLPVPFSRSVTAQQSRGGFSFFGHSSYLTSAPILQSQCQQTLFGAPPVPEVGRACLPKLSPLRRACQPILQRQCQQQSIFARKKTKAVKKPIVYADALCMEAETTSCTEDDEDESFDIEDEKQTEIKIDFMSVVSLQKFDGSWTLQDAAKITSLVFQTLVDLKESKNESAWSTAIVLAFLELKFPSEKDQWALMANKGRLFISGCGEDVNALLKSAQKVLEQNLN